MQDGIRKHVHPVDVILTSKLKRMNMKKNEVTTADNLQIGDRFYFLNDKNKVVWEMVEHEKKVTNYQTYSNWCIPASVSDGRGSETFKAAYVKPIRKETKVVYLRSKEVAV